MGKDLNGKEIGTCIRQCSDGRYIARFTNRFGKLQEIKGRDLKEVKKQFNEALYENEHRLNHQETNLTLDQWLIM